MNDRYSISRLEDAMRQRVVVLDGAMGTLLATGVSAAEAHKQYLLAGADITTANTLAASAQGWNDMVRQAIKDAMREAITARDEYVKSSGKMKWVASSVAPIMAFENSGVMLEAYAQQMGLMLACGADFLLLETFHSYSMLKTALDAIDEMGDNVPFMVAVTANDKGMMAGGGTVHEAIEMASEHNPIAVGLNCCSGSETILPLARLAANSTEVPLIIYPSAGLPNDGVYPDDPQTFAKRMKEVVDELPQVRIIGGCCGTTPQHIAEISKLMN